MAVVVVMTVAGALPIHGQVPLGGVRGVVSDAEFSGPVAQARIQVVELNKEQVTSEDGHFIFEGLPPGTYTVTVSKPGYERHIQSAVIVVAGTLADLAIELKGEFTEMEELTVRDLELTDTASETGLLNLRRNTMSFQDSVSKDLMRRAGAGDAASALKLVVGASVVDGKYATVRGMSDRYVGVALNGMRVPSSDPKKRAVQLDIFPAGTIESMTVSKTFTPDLPGDYSGGGVNIRTISIPDKPFAKGSVSREINSRYTDKEGFVTYEGGGCSQWGRDQGSRAMPAELAGMTQNPILTSSIISGGYLPSAFSLHDQLVDADHPQDPVVDAYDRITRSLSPAMGTKFTKVPDGNYGYSLSGGSRTDVGGGWTFGGIGAFTYGNKYSLLDMAERTYSREQYGGANAADDNEFRRQTGIQEVKDSMLVSMGLTKGDEESFGFTWLRTQTATDRASIRNDVLYPYLMEIDSQVDKLQGIQYTERSTDSKQYTWQRKFDPIEVELYGAHNIVRQYDPDTRRFKEEVSRLGPDTWNSIIPQPGSAIAVYNVSRIWRDIEEDNTLGGINLTLPFRSHESDGRFKVGALKDMTHRTFTQSAFTYLGVSPYRQKPPADNTDTNAQWWTANDANSSSYTTSDPSALWTDTFTADNNIGGGPYVNEMRWYVVPQIGPNNVNYTAVQDLPSGYWMLDYPFTQRLKALAGARLEVTDISIDPVSAYEAIQPGGASYQVLSQKQGAFFFHSATREEVQTHLQESDWLRSMGLVYELAPKMSLRVNWSQTIARPTIRELAPVLSVDPIENENFVGNPELKVSHIQNDDVRWEWFRKPGEVWAVSWFYKSITDPIEKVSFNNYGDPYVVAVNYPEGQVSGMEYEARKDLDFLPDPFSYMHIGANYTRMKSLVVLPSDYANQLKNFGLYPEPRDTSDEYVSPFDQFIKGFVFSFFNITDPGRDKGATRDMEGQPDFLFNFNLGYDIEKWGTSFNWFYNIRGDMLKTGAAVADFAIPDVYTKKVALVNVSLTQKLTKTLSCTVGAQNLLDQEIREVYRLPDGKEIPKRSYREGIRYTFNISGTW